MLLSVTNALTYNYKFFTYFNKGFKHVARAQIKNWQYYKFWLNLTYYEYFFAKLVPAEALFNKLRPAKHLIFRTWPADQFEFETPVLQDSVHQIFSLR